MIISWKLCCYLVDYTETVIKTSLRGKRFLSLTAVIAVMNNMYVTLLNAEADIYSIYANQGKFLCIFCTSLLRINDFEK